MSVFFYVHIFSPPLRFSFCYFIEKIKISTNLHLGFDNCVVQSSNTNLYHCHWRPKALRNINFLSTDICNYRRVRSRVRGDTHQFSLAQYNTFTHHIRSECQLYGSYADFYLPHLFHLLTMIRCILFFYRIKS